MQAARGPRVQGGSDPARPPMQLDPLDDSDEIWAALCLVALQLEQRTQDRAPVEFERQRVTVRDGGRFVQGFSTTKAIEIYQMVLQLTGWLHSHSVTLALSEAYRPQVDHLVETIDSMKRKYPDAPKPFRARMPCPKCGKRELRKVYDLTGEIEALRCERPNGCGAERRF